MYTLVQYTLQTPYMDLTLYKFNWRGFRKPSCKSGYQILFYQNFGTKPLLFQGLIKIWDKEKCFNKY